MRPRVFPAEDAAGVIAALETIPTASMRPRVFPAEDQVTVGVVGFRQAQASMRPRVFPAEDDGESVNTSGSITLQ